nr:immunoglobulin heavy chain junction region [Macaca mulatta]MOV53600.1 immunoglobulin heavy chain junction region [Macaca mulatta]MOV54078.1 immunoglobulin heavy chain junction region [Macaca mulatta]MOV54299.1 immunoglobulin heavy chain junction region [Macaca mulatta]MOV54864.1 immunoglobulin heavy chain junction region [Macaca mulatta]
CVRVSYSGSYYFFRFDVW